MLVDPAVLAVCLGVVALGAVVQGVLGFGLALLSVPVLALVAPELVPVSVLVAVLPLVVLQGARERAHVDLRGLGWALVGRVPGGLLGAAAVAWLPVRRLQLLIALVVLAAVAAAWWADRRPLRGQGPDPQPVPVEGARPGARRGPRRRPRRSTLAAAGALSGLGGTTSGIGGPPMALVYRDAGGQVLRATLATFFLVGALLSLGSLVVVGAVDGAALLAGAVLVPAVLAGYAAASPLRRRGGTEGIRRAVLAVSGAAGVALLAQALLP